jgi:hypothetical protein
MLDRCRRRVLVVAEQVAVPCAVSSTRRRTRRQLRRERPPRSALLDGPIRQQWPDRPSAHAMPMPPLSKGCADVPRKRALAQPEMGPCCCWALWRAADGQVGGRGRLSAPRTAACCRVPTHDGSGWCCGARPPPLPPHADISGSVPLESSSGQPLKHAPVVRQADLAGNAFPAPSASASHALLGRASPPRAYLIRWPRRIPSLAPAPSPVAALAKPLHSSDLLECPRASFASRRRSTAAGAACHRQPPLVAVARVPRRCLPHVRLVRARSERAERGRTPRRRAEEAGRAPEERLLHLVRPPSAHWAPAWRC